MQGREMGKSKDGGKRAVECSKKLPSTEEERRATTVAEKFRD